MMELYTLKQMLMNYLVKLVIWLYVLILLVFSLSLVFNVDIVHLFLPLDLRLTLFLWSMFVWFTCLVYYIEGWVSTVSLTTYSCRADSYVLIQPYVYSINVLTTYSKILFRSNYTLLNFPYLLKKALTCSFFDNLFSESRLVGYHTTYSQRADS